jgi:uncharacterized GH25 family protein
MKTLTKVLVAAPLVMATGTLSCISTVHAHEFIIKPQQLRVESGAKLPFNILATHFFMVSEEAEPANTVKAWAVEGEKRTAIELKENQMSKTLDGVALLNRKGTALLIGHLQEPIEAVTGEGSNKTQRIKREKFAKALITVSTDDDSYKKTLGHKLEIVPVSNVMKARAGDELSFKILLDSKPLKSPVQATYDGFSRRSNTYAYATETLEDGLAYVKVNNPGVWVVRVEKRIEKPTKDHDIHALKAILVFSVQ